MDAESLLNGAMFGRLIAVLTLVLGLILVITWFVRRNGIGGAFHRNTGKTKRLNILETRNIDNQRRLVLIERDTAQHLLLIGGPNDLVIETNIASGTLAGQRGADALADDPLERVRFRDVLPDSGKDDETRILRPGERITPAEDDKA